MSKFLILPRDSDDPKVHPPGTIEATACEIVKDTFRIPGAADKLQAIPGLGPAASIVRLKDETYYSIEVTKKTLNIWHQVIPEIESALNDVSNTLVTIEDDLYRSMSDLNDALSDKSFSGVVPDDTISVWATIGESSIKEIDDAFRDKIKELYKLEKFN